MKAEEKDRALAERIFHNHQGRSTAERFAQWNSTARTLRRAQMTLRSWAKEKQKGMIQRLNENANRPVRMFPFSHIPGWLGAGNYYPIPDRESGALRRIAKACKEAGLQYFYRPTDPDCVLYVAVEPLTERNYHTVGIPCI